MAAVAGSEQGVPASANAMNSGKVSSVESAEPSEEINPKLKDPSNGKLDGDTAMKDVEETEKENGDEEDPKEAALQFKESGNRKYKDGDLYGAIDDYTSAIKLNPSSAAFYNNRAAARLALKQPQTLKAIADCKRAVELEPKNVKALVRLGKALVRRGSMSEAIETFKKAREYAPTNTVARSELQEAIKTEKRLERAQQLMKEGKLNEANMMVNAGLVRAPESPELTMLRIEILLAQGHFQIALKLSNDLLREDQSNIKLLITRAKILYYLENYDQAENHLKQALQNDPDNATAAKLIRKLRKIIRFRKNGNDLFRAREFERAIDEYTKGLEVDPSHKPLNAKLHCNRASALAKLKKNAEAIKDYDKALELDPDYGNAHLRRAACLIQLGGEENLNKAMHSYTEAQRVLGPSREIQNGKRTVKIELKKAKRKDYYKILGLENRENSSEHEIKKAYKKAALKWHPDRHANKGEEEKNKAEAAFKDVNEAMGILSDPKKKEQYDAGRTYEEIEHGTEGGMQGMDPDEIMRMFFGGGNAGGVRFRYG